MDQFIPILCLTSNALYFLFYSRSFFGILASLTYNYSLTYEPIFKQYHITAEEYN